MEIKTKGAFWCLTDSEMVVILNSAARTPKECWANYCERPSVRRAYEQQGWKPVMYKLIQVKDKPIKRENNI